MTDNHPPLSPDELAHLEGLERKAEVYRAEHELEIEERQALKYKRDRLASWLGFAFGSFLGVLFVVALRSGWISA